MILMVLLPFPYLFWGTRNGTCCFSVYLLFSQNPLNVLGHIDDMPEYELEEGEKQVMDPDYVFCPEVHCQQLLQKFSKHLCQHLFFPTSSSTYQTSSEICHACVYDMYTFCHDCVLTEAWAYLWNSWYGCWNLWAQSSCESRLSCIHTTMITKNHWKRLKHGYLRFKI